MVQGWLILCQVVLTNIAKIPNYVNRLQMEAVTINFSSIIAFLADIGKKCYIWFAQHERTLTGASPQIALIVGRLQPRARVSAARQNLKEAGGKRLA